MYDKIHYKKKKKYNKKKKAVYRKGEKYLQSIYPISIQKNS